MVQKLVADSATEIFGVKMMVMNAAWEIDQGLEPRDKVFTIKVAASEMQGRVVDRAIQVFGGMGFSKDLLAERMYRDARVTRIYVTASPDPSHADRAQHHQEHSSGDFHDPSDVLEDHRVFCFARP